MKHTLTDEEVREIAEQFDCGNRCYYNRLTKILLFMPDFNNYFGTDKELYKNEIDELDNNFDDYIEIEKPNSCKSFEIMSNFVESLEDKNLLKSKLTNALRKKKPFGEFKIIIDDSGVFRQQWFDFKRQQLSFWVIQKIEEAE